MKRIWIFGRPGSGKSVTAEKLSKILNIPCFHLDEYIADPNNLWHPVKKETFIAKTKFILDLDSFIVDGNTYAIIDPTGNKVDTFIMLDMGADICIKNIYNRKEIQNRIGFPKFLSEKNEPIAKWNNFIENVKNWKIRPDVKFILETNKSLNTYYFKTYVELDNFIQEITECKLLKNM